MTSRFNVTIGQAHVMVDAMETVKFLSQSETRVTVLRLLQSEDHLSRSTIEARVDASRRTVIRTVRTLSDRGYLTETETGYRLTPFGAFVIASYEELADDLSIAQRMAPFLAHVPSEWFDVDPTVLSDAELVTATEESPYALIDRTLELRDAASRLQHMSPIIERRSVDQMVDRLKSGETIRGTVVIGADAWSAARDEKRYRVTNEVLQAAEQLEFRVYPDRVPFMLCVTGDAVSVGVAKGGRPYAQIVSDHPTLRAWATATFDRILDRTLGLAEI